MVKCRKCGEELPANARFCPGCGAPVDDVPAPKKLEEPLDPLAGGAVPLVPVAPPPRATRISARTPRPHAPHSSARQSRHSLASRYGGSYQAGPREFVPLGEEREARVERAPHDASAPHAKEGPASVGEGAPEEASAPRPDDARDAAEVARSAGPDSHAAVPERASAPHEEPVGPERPADDGAAPTDETGRLEVPRDEAAPQARPAGPSVLERVRSVARSAARRFAELGPDRVPTVVVALLIVVAVSAALAYASMSWFGPFADRSSTAPEFEEPSDGSIDPIQPDEAEDEGPVEGGPEVRTTLEAYSWEELSQISALIADASSDAEGLEIAERYNLCEASGSIDSNNTKNLTLSDGTVVPIAVGGFRHDQKADGSGVAGISFIARASVGNEAVDPTGIPPVWEDAPLRSWLNQSLMAELPPELADLVVAVEKRTNPPVGSGLTEQTVTSELIWIPSYSEVVGPLDQGNRRYGIYESEGEQYQLYADSGVTSVGESGVLALGEYWWLRSPDVVTEQWYLVVSPEGGTPYGHRAGTPDAVVIGFCL